MILPKNCGICHHLCGNFERTWGFYGAFICIHGNSAQGIQIGTLSWSEQVMERQLKSAGFSTKHTVNYWGCHGIFQGFFSTNNYILHVHVTWIAMNILTNKSSTFHIKDSGKSQFPSNLQWWSMMVVELVRNKYTKAIKHRPKNHENMSHVPSCPIMLHHVQSCLSRSFKHIISCFSAPFALPINSNSTHHGDGKRTSDQLGSALKHAHQSINPSMWIDIPMIDVWIPIFGYMTMFLPYP